MLTVDDINLHTWFTERELSYIPGHFTVANTPLQDDSKHWIIEKLIGRYAIATASSGSFLLDDEYPAFEDQKEAVFYELTWS